MRVVYKPIAGERPLWDFPDGTLAAREVAAYAVSEALGWDIVPPTVLGDGPHGPGMVQLWRDEVEDAARRSTSSARGSCPTGFRHVFDGLDAHDQAVSLVHEDSRAAAPDGPLRRGGQQRRPQGRPRPADGRRPPPRRRPRPDLPRRAQAPHRAVGLRRRAAHRRGARRAPPARSRSRGRPRPDTRPGSSPRTRWPPPCAGVSRLLARGAFPAPAASAYPVIPWPPF